MDANVARRADVSEHQPRTTTPSTSRLTVVTPSRTIAECVARATSSRHSPKPKPAEH